jgi:hypothetical protein
MRTFAAMLVLGCLALAARPDRAAAQPAPCAPVYGQAGCDSGCGGCATGYCDGYCGDPRMWGSAEFLLGFRKSRQVPALVTTSPLGTSQIDAGVLGLPSTTTLFGGDGLQDSPQPGGRGEIGVWLDPRARTGVGGSFTGLANESVGFSASSDGSTILARPFFNTLLAQPASQLVAFPGLVRGSVRVQSENEVYAAEAFLRQQIGLWPGQPPVLLLADSLALRVGSLFHLPGTQVSMAEYQALSGASWTRLDFIAGYQFSRVDDSLSITNNLVSLDPSFLGQIGTTLDAFDRFDIRNDFHGGTLGLRTVSHYGRWSLAMLGKVALGNMHQVATIDGETVITVPGGPSATTLGGLLSQASNIGYYDRDRFAVIPEARIMLNYDLTPRLSVGVGYDFIYWNRVALAGDQVDTRVDVTQTLPDPSFSFREGDFFVHAVTFLVQLNH